MRSLWKNSIWIIFLIIVLILLPTSISAHAQTEERSVAVAVGFDRLENGNIEMSAEIVVPRYETTYNQNAQIISAQGKNSADAIAGLSIQTGKVIGLSHCSAFLFGKSMENENIIEFLDQVLRGKRVNYNAQLIFTENKARDVLVKAIEIDKNYNLNINTIVQFNDEFINAKTVLLSDFYKTYYDGYGANFMPVLNLSQNEYEGLANTNQQENQTENNDNSQSNSSQNSTSNSNTFLSNDGKTAIFNNGKIIDILDKEDVLGFGLLTNESTRGIIVLEHVYDRALMDAELSFSIKRRICTKTIDWSENNKPRINYSFRYLIKLEEVKNGNNSTDIVDETKIYLSPKIKQIFSDKIRQECASAINKSKELNLDLLNIYQTFDRFDHNHWQKYLKTLSNKNDYMQDIEFFISIQSDDAS